MSLNQINADRKYIYHPPNISAEDKNYIKPKRND